MNLKIENVYPCHFTCLMIIIEFNTAITLNDKVHLKFTIQQ